MFSNGCLRLRCWANQRTRKGSQVYAARARIIWRRHSSCLSNTVVLVAATPWPNLLGLLGLQCSTAGYTCKTFKPYNFESTVLFLSWFLCTRTTVHCQCQPWAVDDSKLFTRCTKSFGSLKFPGGTLTFIGATVIRTSEISLRRGGVREPISGDNWQLEN